MNVNDFVGPGHPRVRRRYSSSSRKDRSQEEVCIGSRSIADNVPRGQHRMRYSCSSVEKDRARMKVLAPGYEHIICQVWKPLHSSGRLFSRYIDTIFSICVSMSL